MAQHGFSTVLATGRGVERNSTEAIALLRRAAAQNYTPSVRNLELLRIGGSQADPDEAEFLYRYAMANTSDGVFGIGGMERIRLLREAAALNHPRAQNELGVRIIRSLAVSYDAAEAATLFEKAAAQGDADAQFNLGKAYRYGEGVVRDDMKAYMWLALALRGSRNDAESQTKVLEQLDAVKARLKPELREVAQKWADDWKPN